jgi:xanthine dehydrogenase small subunit
MSMIPPSEVAPTFPPTGLAKTELASPRTIEEACDLLARAGLEGKRTVVLAGGTDWIVDRQLMSPDRATLVDRVIDVTRVEALSAIGFHETDGERWMTLGGGVTYWALRRDARVLGTVPMLGVMARDVGAVQIQTRGTLAGNIATASPAADGVPAMMALDAIVVLTSTRGSRRVPLDGFFTAYRKTVMEKDELITAIDVRVPKDGALVTWRKVGTRLAQAISKVALAAVVERDASGVVTRARFGMASVGPVTAPMANVRALVEGKTIASVDRAALDAAIAKDVTPIDDVRSTGEYRMHVAKALVWRALHP